MAKIRVHRERTVHIHPHNDLMRAAVHHREWADQRFARNDLKGINYDILAALVLLAFAVEAQVNFLGDKLIIGWKERAPLDHKLKEVLKHLGITPDWNKRPYSTVRALKDNLRDVLAHGKPYTKRVDEIVVMDQNDPEDLSFTHLQGEWVPYCEGDFCRNAFEDVEEIWEAMFGASGITHFESTTWSSGGLHYIEHVPDHADVARRAYDLWERRGRSHGRDLDDWLQAERELKAGASPARSEAENMKIDELRKLEADKAKKKSGADHHLIIFMPFLRLKAGHSVAGVRFLPLRDAEGKVPSELADADHPLMKILSGYINRHGEPFDNCVVATIPGRGWDVTRGDGPTVMWAASLLFLASWATSHYFPRFGGPYTNSSAFRVTGQGYTGDVPVYIAVVARRRDGSSWDGGYEHGEFTFSIPVQVAIRDVTDVDEPFLAALDKGNAANSPTLKLLRTSLPFVQLANTDDDVMTEHAEAILMGSAFEQLFGTEDKYHLAKAFGELFQKFGSVTVADAQKQRPDIKIDTSDLARAAAQPTWWVHRKWMEELYDLRSSVVHEGQHEAYKWGWSLHEHLVMAAFVFPLAVKLLLVQEGHYVLTSADEAQWKSIDRLLGITGWDTDQEDDNDGRAWHKIVSKAKWDHDFEKRMAEFKKEHPEFSWGSEGADAATT